MTALFDNAGLILVLDEGRRAHMIDSRLRDEDGLFAYLFDWTTRLYEIAPTSFTDVLSAQDWRPKDAELCLISTDGASITFLALAFRESQVATAKYRIRFRYVVPIESIPFAAIEDRIDAKLSSHLVRTSSGVGGRVPPKTWIALAEAISQLDARAFAAMETLNGLRRRPSARLVGNGYETMAEEKDAITLALSFVGRKAAPILRQWTPPDAHESAPFLIGLRTTTMREDAMIANDAKIFGDWTLESQYRMNAAEFREGRDVVTIMNVNRTGVEEALGVDLVYYHHSYQQFTLVRNNSAPGERSVETGVPERVVSRSL